MFQIPAQVTHIQTMADGGVRVVFDTQELTDPAVLAVLFSMKKESIGWLSFKESTITPEDIPNYNPATFDEIKSPSQRLRAVMFVVWKEVKGSKGDFEGFYRAQVERIIEQYKEKLPA